MSKFVIRGAKKLSGEVSISGSKNAVLPLMAACLLTDQECVLKNVPNIVDVQTMCEILTELGVSVERTNDILRINAKGLSNHTPNTDLVGKLRGSILLLGPLLARLGKASIAYPGGDRIGKRPVDTHLLALELLGAKIDQNDQINLSTEKLVGTKVILQETSVTATENVMMAAATASGTTIIKLAAMEPHVQQLGQFLNLMGADVSGLGSPTITIKGTETLHGAEISVIADSEEAASWITLAAATKSEVKVKNLNPDFLEDYLLKLQNMHVNFQVGENFVQVLPPTQDYVGTKIQCGFYPKLNSDYVPPMSVLATQAVGETYVFEWLYENRFGYVTELKKMGANTEVLDPHRVKIVGPTKLVGQKITSYDLRMGMTLVIAALIAEGESEISDIHHVDRGYADLDGKLRALGADIKRIE